MDAWRIGAAHADVVQHGCLLDKLKVHRLAFVNKALAQPDGQVGHLTAMKNQHPVIVITGCVVSLND
jgi:hypothetical protein